MRNLTPRAVVVGVLLAGGALAAVLAPASARAAERPEQSGPQAAGPGPGVPEPERPRRPRRGGYRSGQTQGKGGEATFASYEDCRSTATFRVMLEEGTRRWGLRRQDSASVLERVEGYSLCSALAAGSDEPCGQLERVPAFPAAKQRAAECRERFWLFSTYGALARKDWASAESGCARWYEGKKAAYGPELEPKELCGKLIPLLKENGDGACKKLGRLLGGGGAEEKDTYILCAVYLAPKKQVCADDDNPDLPQPCLDRVALRAAVSAARPASCPRDPRTQAGCRLLAGAGPEESCAPLAAGLVSQYCDARFDPGGRRTR